ncbi:hypothetical protein Tco_0320222 [Tanacetum coccineum]
MRDSGRFRDWVKISSAITTEKNPTDSDVVEVGQKLGGLVKDAMGWASALVCRANGLIEARFPVDDGSRPEYFFVSSASKRRIKESQWEDLKRTLDSIHLSNTEDRWFRSRNGSGLFSVASTRRLIDNLILTSGGEATKWCNLLPHQAVMLSDSALLEQGPHPSEYVPDPMELEDHVPVYIPEPEHPEDLVPAEDEAPIEPYITERRATTPSIYHSLLLAGTPPLLPIPLHASSTSRKADIPEADTPPRKRLLLTVPIPRVEVGESSAATAARQPRSTMARRVDHSFVDTMDTRVRDTERRTMAAVEVANLRVSYQAYVRRRESLGFYSRHQEAQEDQVAVRAEIEILRRERLAYEQESIKTRQVLARSKAYSRALEARIRVLETQAYRREWQRQDADDRAIEHIICTQALEAGARVDTLEDTGSSA